MVMQISALDNRNLSKQVSINQERLLKKIILMYNVLIDKTNQ